MGHFLEPFIICSENLAPYLSIVPSIVTKWRTDGERTIDFGNGSMGQVGLKPLPLSIVESEMIFSLVPALAADLGNLEKEPADSEFFYSPRIPSKGISMILHFSTRLWKCVTKFSFKFLWSGVEWNIRGRVALTVKFSREGGELDDALKLSIKTDGWTDHYLYLLFIPVRFLLASQSSRRRRTS